jgi:hypothetical protein
MPQYKIKFIELFDKVRAMINERISNPER